MTCDGSVSELILKDLNWIKMGHKIKLDQQSRAKLLETLQKDSSFLSSINIIDYSLLVGVVEHQDEQLEKKDADLNNSRVSLSGVSVHGGVSSV